MARRLFWVVAALFLGLYWYLLLDGRADGDGPAPRIDISRLRELSQAVPGPAPTDIVAYVTAVDRKPGNLLVAGSGFHAPHVAAIGYAINYARQPAIVIDAAMDERAAIAQDVEGYSATRRAELDRRIEQASTILLTGTGPFYASGLHTLRRARLGEAQARVLRAQIPADTEQEQMPNLLPDDRPSAIAPGIVSIPAPGFDAATRMIYVRMISGRELLFTGPNAPIARAWHAQKPPARIVTDMLENRDRAAMRGWLQVIADLKRQAPDLIVIAGNDIDMLEREIQDSDAALGLLRYGLRQPGIFVPPGED
ncbi:hypothetical protein [uncultured Croceicoccus sp.]|uniref:hypothetical protein n=1 Tax=uncultured Croceicoccus sp. TaxID=1295329 RepID=UPI002631A024|nr:hypothetical protein [uncultured Croceicoccus sp.]